METKRVRIGTRIEWFTSQNNDQALYAGTSSCFVSDLFWIYNYCGIIHGPLLSLIYLSLVRKLELV
jgi:hypothetical protein